MSITETIYASKLYQRSNRKARIHAALVDPGNKGLVTQMAEDLDEEYQTPDVIGEPADAELETDAEVDESLDPGLGEGFSGRDNLAHISDFSGGSFGGDEAEGDFNSEGEGADFDLGDVPEGDESGSFDDAPAAEPEEAPIEESTAIKACITVDTDTIKGSLNGVAETAGVNRIQTKENELWIYYNDDTNLNNVMTEVIEFLNKSGETYLEFNRLARSDNAMVFVINQETQPIQTKESIEASDAVEPVQKVGGNKKQISSEKPAPAASAYERIIKDARALKSSEFSNPVTEVLRKGNDIEVTFKDGSTLTITSDLVKDGAKAIQKLTDAVSKSLQ